MRMKNGRTASMNQICVCRWWRVFHAMGRYTANKRTTASMQEKSDIRTKQYNEIGISNAIITWFMFVLFLFLFVFVNSTGVFAGSASHSFPFSHISTRFPVAIQTVSMFLYHFISNSFKGFAFDEFQCEIQCTHKWVKEEDKARYRESFMLWNVNLKMTCSLFSQVEKAWQRPQEPWFNIHKWAHTCDWLHHTLYALSCLV